jgi:hypothetical protein
MKRSRKNIIHSHKEFAEELKKLVDFYDLKINSATFSFAQDQKNNPVLSFYSIETGYQLVATRDWYEY